MRPIIIHHHIFKNAGSSVDQCLQDSFPNDWRAFEGPFPWSSVSRDDLLQHLADTPGCRAISSHQARFVRPQVVNGLRLFPIVFLRNPIDRVGSCFSYDRAHRDDGNPTSLAAQQGLAYYIDYCLGDGDQINASVICNYQVLHLSHALDGLQDTRQIAATAHHLKQAIDAIDTLPAFGLVEEFRQSARLLNRWIRPSVPAFYMANSVSNSSNRHGALRSRIDSMRKEIGEARFERLLDHNRFDMQLYGYAHIRFHSLLDILDGRITPWLQTERDSVS